MCKSRYKVCNGQNIPTKYQILQIIFLKAFYKQLMSFFHKMETILSNQYFPNCFCPLLKTQNVLKQCVICVTKCAMPKIDCQSDLHGKMNLNLVSLV